LTDIFDIAVFGAGSSGISAAMSGADLGARVCIVEMDRIGGSQLRKGFYPIKSAIGFIKNNEPDVKIDGVVNAEVLNDNINKSMMSLSEKWEKDLIESGVTIINGIGSLSSSGIISVEANEKSIDIRAKKIIIATGSKPIALPAIPFEEGVIISSDDAFIDSSIPKTVFIMGADENGCELAHFYQALGSKVFLGSYDSRLMGQLDPDIVEIIEKSLKKFKVKFLLGKKILSYYKNNKLLDITLDGGIKFQVEKIIQNLERQGNSLEIGCDLQEIRLGGNKEILVNEKFETSTENIYAVGSITGRLSRPGISIEEGRVVAGNAMGKNKLMNPDWVPRIIFIEPEIACVGCFAQEAHHKGFRGVEGKAMLEDLDFSIINNNLDGFFKIVADARSGIVIGGQISSPNASQLILLVLMAIKKGLKVGALAFLASDKSNEIEGIKEAARLCSKALKSN
jgi:dihydrolipoamide dehydrogenase